MATIAVCAALLCGGAGRAVTASPADHTLVVSRTYNGYERTLLPDGSYLPETFILAEGGMLAEERSVGDSVSTIGFAQVAKTIAEALRSQNFLPTTDQEQASQVIMVWYGSVRRTLDRSGPAHRLTVDRKAHILGFEQELNQARSLHFLSFAEDFANEFDVDRYFVVLRAFDFQVARRDRQLKLLWESRFSIRRQGADFAASLPDMTTRVARTFGHATAGIHRPDSRKAHVELGDLEVVAEEEEEPR